VAALSRPDVQGEVTLPGAGWAVEAGPLYPLRLSTVPPQRPLPYAVSSAAPTSGGGPGARSRSCGSGAGMACFCQACHP